MHDEFTVVNYKRRTRKQGNIVQVGRPEKETDPLKSIKLNRKLSEILESLEQKEFTKHFLNDIDLVLNKLNRTEIDLILCYGLGKFSESSCSLHQLALLILLKNNLRSTIQIFDPIFDDIEIKILKDLNFEIIKDNEEGKHIVDKEKLTLVFLPHCPNQLVNNFLWANWNSNLRNCIIISNSFSKIIENNTKKTINHSANYIAKSFDLCEEISVKDTYEYPNVFNDISIHYFHKLDAKSTFFQSPAEEPVYLEDTEFIRKKKPCAK